MIKKIRKWIHGWKMVKFEGYEFRVRDFIDWRVQCLHCKTVFAHDEYITNEDGDFICPHFLCKGKEQSFREFPVTKSQIAEGSYGRDVFIFEFWPEEHKRLCPNI